MSEVGISEQSFYRWKKEYGNLQPSEGRELKQLRDENTKLNASGNYPLTVGISEIYRDVRLGGTERLSFGPPKDHKMRVPDDVLKCVCFLCVQDSAGTWRYGGTGFFVQVRSETNPDRGFNYCVTAKHCVVAAMATLGKLFLRINVHGGDAKYIEVTAPWVLGEGASDVAVLPIVLDYDRFDSQNLPLENLVGDELLAEYGIGIGDELIVTGLFDSSTGRNRNRPLLRSGIISAMPDEPILDDKAREFNAYIAEVRSIGGLSGSPVFVVIPTLRLAVGTRPDGDITKPIIRFFLLGLIRGHWKYESAGNGFLQDDAKHVNKGMALVTPSHDLRKILLGDHLVALRKAADYYHATLDAPTDDTSFIRKDIPDSSESLSDGEGITEAEFIDALKRVTRKQSDEEKS